MCFLLAPPPPHTQEPSVYTKMFKKPCDLDITSVSHKDTNKGEPMRSLSLFVL